MLTLDELFIRRSDLQMQMLSTIRYRRLYTAVEFADEMDNLARCIYALGLRIEHALNTGGLLG